MKKVAALTATITSLAAPAAAFAQNLGVQISQTEGQTGIANTRDPGTILSNVFTIVFVVAVVIVLFMLIAGAFQWITSGGDKEAVAKARSRITHALIGLAILALAYLILRVVAQIVGVDLTNVQTLPTLYQ